MPTLSHGRSFPFVAINIVTCCMSTPCMGVKHYRHRHYHEHVSRPRKPHAFDLLQACITHAACSALRHADVSSSKRFMLETPTHGYPTSKRMACCDNMDICTERTAPAVEGALRQQKRAHRAEGALRQRWLRAHCASDEAFVYHNGVFRVGTIKENMSKGSAFKSCV